MTLDSQPSVYVTRRVNDVAGVTETPASEQPTAPDAPVPGVAIDPATVLPDDALTEPPIEDALSALQRRDHPFHQA